MAKDLTYGMEMDEKTVQHKMEHDEIISYFCCEGCKNTFKGRLVRTK